MHKKATVDGKEYYVRRHPHGYGWELMERTPVLKDMPDGTTEDWGGGTYKSLYHHSQKGPVTHFFQFFEKGKVFTDFPQPHPVECPEKILIHRTKHFTAHYSVPTLESLEKTLRHILVTEYGDTVDHLQPEDLVTNNSGVKSMDEVETIPIEEVREKVREEFKKYLLKVKELARYKKDWLNLKQVLAGKGNVFSAMEAFEEDKYEYEKLITIS